MKGTVLGAKYRLLRQIAEGGMGTVWEAEHVEIGRRLAVKLLQDQFCRNAEVVARFRREAQIAGTLGHDHICPVLDVGSTSDGRHYLVMEMLRGRSLAEVLASAGALSIERALDIAAQILEALVAAHEAGVVHRDLKPENVFLSRVGTHDDFVRVLDFGISKITAEDGGRPGAAVTRTGCVMGTPQYMAPEQARGRRDLDSRVDVWATGAILYEMLTGRRAYEGDSVNEIIVKLVTEPFAPPRSHRPDLPADVEALVIRAMARRREDRFATAAEMREAVLRARSLPRCEDVAASGASLAPTTPAATPLVVARTAPPAPPARTTRRGLLVVIVLAAGAAAIGLLAWVATEGDLGSASNGPPGAVSAGTGSAAVPPLAVPPRIPEGTPDGPQVAQGAASGPVAPAAAPEPPPAHPAVSPAAAARPVPSGRSPGAKLRPAARAERPVREGGRPSSPPGRSSPPGDAPDIVRDSPGPGEPDIVR